MKYYYLIMDSRAITDIDNATVFEHCETLKEAKENKDDYGDDCIIARYEEHGDKLKNPVIIN